MTIFNSLGSNYDFAFVFKALFADFIKYKKKLQEFLGKKYQGDVFLVYKGREALRLALQMINQKGSSVAICGFTCYAVYDAVVKEGYNVEYLDIEKDSLNFSFDTLKKYIQENSKIKIVIIQNTLGYPCEIEKISEFCKKNNIILVEDLAHSIGTVYEKNKEAGSFGDFVVLSFSQDKVIDGVSGGALILRNKSLQFPTSPTHGTSNFQNVGKWKQFIDRLYPLFTYKIRKWYVSGFGKILHRLLKTFHLLSNPMADLGKIHNLPSWYCSLIYNEFSNLEKNLDHRKKIARIYSENINKDLLNEKIDKQVSFSANLRFPIFVENREGLVEYLKKENIFVSDIWYDSPIAPKKYLHLTNYENECPESESISSKILNLPTHKNVSEKDAKYISKKINQWLVS